MQNFLTATVKVVTDVAEIPNILIKSFINYKPNKSDKSVAYGGFIDDDWKKIGRDMKRGLISFGKSK